MAKKATAKSTSQPELVPTPETPAPQKNELTVLLDSFHVEATTSDALKLAFEGAFIQAKEWSEKAKSIKVTDATQLKEMKLARESRLALRPVRTDVEKKRKELKADALNYGRAVDGIANYLKELIEPIEDYLLEQEEFAKRIEAQRVEEMKQARIQELTGWGVDTQYLDLGGMPDPVYQKLLTDSKAAHEARLEAQRKAEEEAARIEAERLAAEKAERERQELQRLENERLKREAEERQAQIEKERREMEAKLAEERRIAEIARKEAEAKAQAEAAKLQAEANKLAQQALYDQQVAAQRLAEQEEKAKAERAALEAKHKAEQAKRAAEMKARQEEADKKMAEEKAKWDQIEREAAAKRAAEEARVKAEQSAAKKAAKAPDKDKLVAFAAQVRALQIPDLTTEEGKAVKDLLIQQTERFAVWIDGQATKL